MNLTNNEIYTYAVKLEEFFLEMEEKKIPIKINFYLQKNKNILIELAKDIEKARLNIIENYSSLNEETEERTIDLNEKEKVTQELIELLNLTQEVQIYKIKIDDFPNDLFLTTNQMETLMFMIEE